MTPMKRYPKLAGEIFPAHHTTTHGGISMSRMRSILIAVVALVAVMALASSASAYCGPGFTNKKQALAYYHTPAGQKLLPSMKTQLIKKGFMHADQSVMAFLESPRVSYQTTPKGFVLDYNTSCSGSAYSVYDGRYAHGNMGVLAVTVKKTKGKIGKAKKGKSTTKTVSTSPEISLPQPDGSTDIYVDETQETSTSYAQKYHECSYYRAMMKAYCRNIVHSSTWHKCKTYVKHFAKKVKKVVRKFVRKIPAPSGSPSPEGPKTGPVSAKQQCEQGGDKYVWNDERQQCFVIVGNCSIIVVGGSPTITVNGDICSTTTTPPPDCGCHQPPPPPAKTHAYLTKAAYVDGAMVTLSGGEFTFSKIVNGGSSTSLTNPASNQSKDLGEFEVGDSVQVCETNSAGYIPDEPCITHTFTTAGEKFTFAFVNRKTSPPPPPPSCQSQGTCPKPGLSITEVNDLDTGQQYDYYCATAQLPAGHTGTMRMSVKYGHWGSRVGSIQFKLTGGTQTFCATIADGTVLTAPKEVPSSGTDTVTVSATDDTYQSSISDSTTYNVQEPRTNPA